MIEGFNGDAARTFAVGVISDEKQRLIDVTKQSFFEGIKHAKAGRRLGDLSHAIQSYVESHGYSVVRSMCGHGIGRALHEDPSIPNYGTANTGVMLKSGYCLAVEPMVNMGSFKVDLNGWLCKTSDGKPSAHYENTIIVTNGEPEIITL
jgi:methionyl aminopeptidase